MKVLFIANVIEEHILKFHIPTIKAFYENGHIVDVFAAGSSAVPFVRETYYARWKRNPFSPSNIIGLKQLKKLLSEERYDVIFCHTPVGGLLGRLAASKARKQGTMVIYCAHGLHFYKGAPLKNWLFYLPIEKILAKKTDYIFTVNDEDFKLAKKFLKSNILLVPEVGVNLDRLSVVNKVKSRTIYREKLGISDNDLVLIYVAELIKNKNQSMLIDALSEIRKTKPNTYLLLVGPDHYNGKYQLEAKKKGQESHIRFLGWRSDIGELLATSDICVASSKREGFGINIVEAMYMNLPVVASDNRGHRSIITNEKNGYLIKNDDYREMAQKVLDISSDKHLFSSLIGFDVSKYEANYIGRFLYEILVKLYKKRMGDVNETFGVSNNGHL